MPKKREKERLVCEHFVWLLGQRGNVYVADGRSNTPPLGRHSLGTTNYDEAKVALCRLDLVKAVELGKADRNVLEWNEAETLGLEAGWNLISNPYNGNVKLDNVQVRRNGSTTNTWSSAASSGWIETAVYYYLGDEWGETNTSEFGAEAELVPWMGYWMYVKDASNSYELIITKPAQ